MFLPSTSGASSSSFFAETNESVVKPLVDLIEKYPQQTHHDPTLLLFVGVANECYFTNIVNLPSSNKQYSLPLSNRRLLP